MILKEAIELNTRCLDNMSKKVLIAIPSFDFDPANSQNGISLLKDRGYEVYQLDHYPSDSEILPIAGEYDAMITCGGFSPNKKFFDEAKKLKILSRYGIGFDEIDIAEATAHGVKVTTTRVAEHLNGVAELALSLIMSILYHIPHRYAEYCLNGNFKQVLENRQLRGKTVGLFGFGGIAKSLAAILNSAGVNLLAYDIFQDEESAKKLNVRYVDKETILKESDIISIHVPAIPENRHLFNTETFSMMKDGAYLINTARGMLVDESALYDALQSGKLSGAATDVLDPEPSAPDNPLFMLSNFVATPHIGGHNYEAREAMSVSAAKAIVDFFDGKKPNFLVNP